MCVYSYNIACGVWVKPRRALARFVFIFLVYLYRLYLLAFTSDIVTMQNASGVFVRIAVTIQYFVEIVKTKRVNRIQRRCSRKFRTPFLQV